MESLVKQKRVSFSGSGQHSKEASQRIRERTREDKVQNWFLRQFPQQMSRDHGAEDKDFATAVAAVAFAIHSLEEPNLPYQKTTREGLGKSISRLKTRKEDTPGFFGKESQSPGETSIRNPMANNGNSLDSAFPTIRPGNASLVRSVSAVARENSTRNRGVGTKADTWEKAQMAKIKKRYDNMNSRIVDWENEKKLRAKLSMEKKKSELEQRKALNYRHYQIKTERIDQIAAGAKAQVQEKRRNEESEVKDKAEMIRRTGKVPVSCFCF